MSGIVHDVSSSGATVFIEPMGVVDAGNQVRELQLAEEREVRRVLQRLTALLGDAAEAQPSRSMALAQLDLLSATVRLGRRIKAPSSRHRATSRRWLHGHRVPRCSSAGVTRS